MSVTIEDKAVIPVATASPVQVARDAAIEALNARNVNAFGGAMETLAACIGAKPMKADFLSKDGFKSAMDRWAEDKAVLRDVLHAASAAGFAVKDTFTARGLKSGAVSIAHRRAVTIRPTGATWKI